MHLFLKRLSAAAGVRPRFLQADIDAYKSEAEYLEYVVAQGAHNAFARRVVEIREIVPRLD